MRLRLLPALCALLVALPIATAPAAAQDRGYWRAASTTARGVTGDIALSELKVTINFASFTIAEIRALTSDEEAAVFSGADAGGVGDLYRLSIPADKKFLHKNTLCGADDAQWMATYVTGKQMRVAFFSGNAMPPMTPEAMVNATSLCGTYGYVP